MESKTKLHAKIGDYSHWACWQTFQDYKAPPCCECQQHSCIGRDETVYALPLRDDEWDEIPPGTGRQYPENVKVENDGDRVARVMVGFDE